MDDLDVTADTFSQTSNTQRENSNAILTSEMIDKSDELVEKLKDLTINDAEYYISDSANVNDAKGGPTSNPKAITHNSDGKKRKVTYTSNRILQQKILSSQTFSIITTTMDPRIRSMVTTSGGTPHTLAKPTT